MKKKSLLLLPLLTILVLGCKKDNEPTNPITIGNFYEGGYIFYIDNSGKHGLVAAPPITDVELPWGCSGSSLGVTYKDIGSGSINTQKIVSNCSDANSAAKYCSDLGSGGYLDWFLPSEKELKQLILQLKDIDTVKIATGYPNFWSSSESEIVSTSFAFIRSYVQYNLENVNGNKASKCRVRAVRAF